MQELQTNIATSMVASYLKPHPNLTEQQQGRLNRLINKYAGRFAEDLADGDDPEYLARKYAKRLAEDLEDGWFLLEPLDQSHRFLVNPTR